MDIKISTVEASSHYQSKKYGEDGLAGFNVIEDAPKFGGWLSNLNAWEGSWLRFDFMQPELPKKLAILNGFIEPGKAEERDDYFFHLRAKDIQLVTETEDRSLVLQDTKELQTFELSLTQATSRITIIINSVYRDSPDGTITSHDVVGFRKVKWS